MMRNRFVKTRLYQKDIDQSKLNRLESENRELKDLDVNQEFCIQVLKQVVSRLSSRNLWFVGSGNLLTG